MQFVELDMYEAIYEVRKKMVEAGERHGESYWENDEEGRIELCRRILQEMIVNCDQKLINAWVEYRKRPKAAGTSTNKYDLTIEVARLRGRTCFYSMLGGCSDDVHLDRLVPGGEYSLANCVISCGFHNTSRGDKPLGEFLSINKSIDATYQAEG